MHEHFDYVNFQWMDIVVSWMDIGSKWLHIQYSTASNVYYFSKMAVI